MNTDLVDNSSSMFITIAESILNNDDTCIRFLLEKGEYFEGIRIEDLFKHFLGLNSNRFNQKVRNRLFMVIKKYNLNERDVFPFEINQELNPDFERAIVEDIDINAIPEEIAYSLYDSLNRKLSFDTDFGVSGSNLNIPIAREKYYRNIKDVSMNDKIVCSVWSNIYAYLITKYAGAKQVIIKGKKHKYIVAIIGKSIIEADATASTESMEDASVFTDLVRAKLRLRPAGFEISCTLGDISISNFSLYKKLHLYNILDEIGILPDKDEISELTCLINESLGMEEDNHNTKDAVKEIGHKIVFINELLKRADLKESTECIGYLKQIFETILGDEKRTELLSRSFYRINKNSASSYEFVPIISLYLGSLKKNIDERTTKEYIYLTFSEGEHQFKTIKREEFLELVKNGTITRLHNYFRINIINSILLKMGLSELATDNINDCLYGKDDEEIDGFVWPSI